MLVAIAAVSAIAAAAIPTHAVADNGLAFIGPPKQIERSDAMHLAIAGRTVSITPPTGYMLAQVGEGDPSHAHVTLRPFFGSGDNLVVRFTVPSGIREGAVIGIHDGTAIRETRFGTLWRSRLGLLVLVTGGSTVARVSVIDGLTVT